MLINTVLLFLQNGLPISIITALLLLRFSSKNIKKTTLKWIFLNVTVVIILASILSCFLENISQTFNNKGVELFTCFGIVLVYLSSVGLFVLKSSNKNTLIKISLALIIFFIISCFNGAHFIIYFTSYWSKVQPIQPMLIGLVLGGGICLSIAIIFYFSLKYFDQNINSNTSNYFLLFFTVGQLMQVIVQLQQVDILPSSQPIWDSGKFIAENSELGQLLTVLFGYETTPSPLQLSIYFIAFIIPLVTHNFKAFLLLFYGEKT